MTHLTIAGARGFAIVRHWLALGLLGVSALLSGCGSSSTSQSVIAVQTPQLVSIAVDPPEPSLALGLSTQFTATGIYTDGSQHDLSQSVTWTSSNPAVASVSNSGNANGLTTGVSQGTATITATLGLVSGKATLTVGPASLEFIAVTPTTPTLAVGATQQFTATGVYSDNSTRNLTTTVTWTSGNANIAAVSNAVATYGLGTGVSIGSTTITAALANLSGSTTVTVAASTATLVAIAVTPANAGVAKGATQAFLAMGTYSNGTTQNLTTQVTWSSATPAIATINAAGVATGVAVGATAITASLGPVSGSASLTVSTPTLVSIAVTPSNASIAARTTQQFTATGTYSDGTTQNITATAAWASSQTTVATISNVGGTKGLATAVNIGTTAITAVLGAIAAAPVTLTVTAAAQYAYAVNYGPPPAPGTVLQYSVNAATGALTALTPAAVSVGSGPFSLAVDPTDSYVYVADYDDEIILQFQIGANGTLTGIGIPVATGANPNGITVDPQGRFLYIANFGDQVNPSTLAQYAITGGVLSDLPVQTVTAGIGPTSVAIDPSNTFLYVSNYGDGVAPGTVSEFSIGAGGVLNLIGTATAGVEANEVVIGPGAQFAYTVNQGDNTVSLFSIAANGVLTAQGTAATGLNGPRNMVFDATGTYAYLTNRFGNTVQEYSLTAATGQLTPLGSVPAPSAEGITIDQTNSYVYVTDRATNAISEFSINHATGALTLVDTLVLPVGTTPTGIITAY